jgi:UDP-N-acetylglucosamine--dolichyl-phosphate N-acetylglucosaminephosphotransferase
MVFLVFIISFAVSFVGFPIIIPGLKKAGIMGKNMNSEEQEEVAEMGGLVIVAGYSAGIILIISLKTFFDLFTLVSLTSILAAFSTIMIVALIGIFDDLISIKQGIKAFMPVFAALPLIALKEGFTIMKVPFIGFVDFGIYYHLIIIPLGITGAANAVNMLAGFNGLEAGMGLVAVGSLVIIAYLIGETTAFILSIIMLGALFATLYFNWFPAKILIGDVGTLTIGAVIASVVIIGNYEMAGGIIIIPYVVDFIIKAKNRFPYSFGIYREGKLYCPDSGAVGLGQLIMKICGGISERNLVLVLMGIEAVFGIIAILLYI